MNTTTTRVTKASLIVECTALHLEVAQLKADLQHALGTVRQVREQLLAVTSCASAVNSMHRPAVRPAYVQPDWQLDRVRAMAEAKAEAMAGNCMIRV